jgi:hypothetical protein
MDAIYEPAAVSPELDEFVELATGKALVSGVCEPSFSWPVVVNSMLDSAVA